MQTYENGLDALVAQVALGVDREGVAAQRVADRPRLDPREVDPAGAELLEHAQQRAGLVVRELDQQSGFVRARPFGLRPGKAHHDEPGDGAGVVGDVVGERLEAHEHDGGGRAQGRLEAGAVRFGEGFRAGGGRRRRHVDDRAEALGDPSAALRPRVRVSRYGADVLAARARPDRERERDRHEHLCFDLQRGAVRQRVEGCVDPALDGVFDRDDGVVRLARAHEPERHRNVERRNLDRIGRGHLFQRRVRERSRRSQERKAQGGLLCRAHWSPSARFLLARAPSSRSHTLPAGFREDGPTLRNVGDALAWPRTAACALPRFHASAGRSCIGKALSHPQGVFASAGL